MSIRVISVEPGSIAEELGIQPGDELFRMNGEPVNDELDVKFHMPAEELEIEIITAGEFTALEIEKDYGEDVGFVVEPMKMGGCGNDCVFCFVDQNPEGLRKALYFRDGDYRFSHLYGNYNTMTNVGPQALERIVRQRLVPQYISVHSTDLDVRKKLMRLRKDDHIMDKLRYLAENDVWMHTQVVLCPGINDGAALERTVEDIYSLGPTVQTMAIVPVGLTSHREGLEELRQVDREYARNLIEWIYGLQERFRAERGSNWIYVSDEFFLVAELEPPAEEWYDGYPQLENGVGMVRDFIEETQNEVEQLKRSNPLAAPRRLTLATAALASGFMREYIVPILQTIPNLEVDLQVVINTLYGPDVTVTGLLSGQCFERHFSGQPASDLLLLPPNVLNEDDVFLDDQTPLGLKQRLSDRPMALFHGKWEEVLYYLEHPHAEAFDTKRMKLPVI
jgi:putative radical SAM enzyme (TIGR03279 family)